MINMPKFVKEHVPLYVSGLGMAIVGYLGYHAVRWIINKCQKTEKEKLAAVKIQRAYRRRIARLKLKRSRAAVEIQRAYRGYIARLALKTLAAVKIQRAYRDHIARLELKRSGTAAVKIQRAYRSHIARLKLKRFRDAVKIQCIFYDCVARLEIQKLLTALNNCNLPVNEKQLNQMKRSRL